jgi:hypothetical protein
MSPTSFRVSCGVTVSNICYHGKEPRINELRPGEVLYGDSNSAYVV